MNENFWQEFLKIKNKLKNKFENLKQIKLENIVWNKLPKENKEEIVAIDGSYNYVRYKSFVFYAISAVALEFNGKSKIYTSFESDIVYNFVEIEDYLKVKMILKELELAKKFDKNVMLDGSFSSFYNFTPSLISLLSKEERKKIRENFEKMNEEELDKLQAVYFNILKIRKIIKELSEKNNLIFSVAKSISAKRYSKIPDIFIFDLFEEGYSEIYEEKVGLNFITIYFKLSKNSQIFKLTTFEKNKDKIERILSILKAYEVNGYPYPLTQAHKNCKITNEEIKKMIKIIGITEKTGREVLL
ncbi:MAG: DNA double-strand break repair nuclease NurA [Candidatus Aenigmatarchaeota archaeon]